METTAQHWDHRVGRRLKLRDLHILSTVVQQGSMAKAAAQLAMSQPAVSEAVASLEDALHVRLLDRSTRGVEPTVYADALLRRGRVVFDELREAINELEFLSNPAIGEVRVACGDTTAAGLLPEVINRMSRRHPKIAIRVVQSSAETFSELRDRRVDLALARASSNAADNEINVEVLFEDRHRVVAGLRSPWARRRKLTLADLVDERWVFASNPVIRELIAEAFQEQGLELPHDSVSANSILLRNQLLATGRFLTILPESVVRCNAKQWSVKALPIDFGVRPRALVLATLKKRTIAPVVRLFIEQVRVVAETFAGDAPA